jgi:hypothetical protein
MLAVILFSGGLNSTVAQNSEGELSAKMLPDSHTHVQYKLCLEIKLVNNSETCIKCVHGYFLQHGLCHKCPYHCDKCSQAGCYNCHIGSYLHNG